MTDQSREMTPPIDEAEIHLQEGMTAVRMGDFNSAAGSFRRAAVAEYPGGGGRGRQPTDGGSTSQSGAVVPSGAGDCGRRYRERSREGCH